MNRPVLLFLCGGLFLSAQNMLAFAQRPGERRVRIDITRNENGSESHVTREFDLNDEQQLADALRELGVMDELNIIGEDENLVLDLRRMRDGGILNDMCVALSAADEAMAAGEPRAYLGVYYGNWNESCDKEARKKGPPVKEGACITAVEDDTPAQRSGLKEGDVIIAMDGRSIRNGEDLADAIGDHHPGDDVKVIFYRGKEKKTVNVTLASKKEDPESMSWGWNWSDNGDAHDQAMREHDEAMREHELAMAELADAFRSQQDGAFLGVDGEDMPDDGGVRITGVVDSSAAQRMGLREGDIITGINGERIEDFEDLADLMDDSEPESDARVSVRRDQQEITLNGKLGRREGVTWNWEEGSPAPFPFMTPMAPMVPMAPMAPMPRSGEQYMDPEERADFERDIAEYQQDIAEYARDMAEYARDREEQRREMDELRREMDRLRRDLRGDVMREVRVTVDAVRLTQEENDVLKNKGVTGLETTLELPGLRVSPNPSSGSFDLTFQVPERGDLSVDVHDANGDRVYHESITGFKGNYERVLDMSDRAAGTYFVVISQNGKAQARKVMKQ